jgi:hypothetical protein
LDELGIWDLTVAPFHYAGESEFQSSRPSSPRDQLSEKTSESGIVASLAASPLYRERPASAFDLATMLDA